MVIYSIVTYLETLSGYSALLLYNDTLILFHTNVIRKPAQLFAYDFDNGNDDKRKNLQKIDSSVALGGPLVPRWPLVAPLGLPPTSFPHG